MKENYKDIHKEIIELSKSGKRRAQYELYSLYSRAMFNVCMRILNRREEAEDALQEAFTSIFDKLDTFRYDSSFGAWTKRIVVNTCINKLNKKTPDLFLYDQVPEENHENEEPDLSDIQLQAEKVRSAIFSLPEGYRVVLSLYLLEGYDHKEISEIMGISESTSKTQYMKARKKVKEILTTNHERQI